MEQDTLDLCLEMDSSWPILCGAEIHGLEFQFCQKTPKTVLLVTQQPNVQGCKKIGTTVPAVLKEVLRSIGRFRTN